MPVVVHAAFPNVPDTGTAALGIGTNSVAVASDGSTYVGGTFGTTAGKPSQSIFGYNTSTQQYTTSMLSPNNSLANSVSDNQGGWYVAGSFTEIGGLSRNFVAHILANGTVDPVFNPAISGGSSVNDLVLSPDGLTLYAAGAFTATQSNNLIGLNATTGAATSFDADTDSTTNTVAISPDGLTIYAGGFFTTVNGGTTRNSAAGFNATTGVATSFNPNLDSGVDDLQVSPDGLLVYATGGFATVNGGTSRNYLAAFSASTGVANSFNPNLDSFGYEIDLSADGNTLYANGLFTTVNGGIARDRVAAFNTSNSVATGFNPTLSDSPASMLYRSATNTVYLGFSSGGFMSFDGTTGVINPGQTFADGAIHGLSADASGINILGVGAFNSAAMTPVPQSLVRILADGTIDPNFSPNVSGNVASLKLSPDGNTLYAGGNFTTVNGGTTRNRLAAFSTATGIATSFDPSIASSSVNALALSADGSTLYVGGGFTSVNGGTTRNRLAAFSTATGIATSFNPNMSSTVSSLALNADGSTLYAGGNFTTVNGGTSRTRLTSFATAGTGTVNSFNPIMSASVLALVVDADGDVYAGGSFATVGGVPRDSFAHIFTAGAGSLDTDFNPNPNDTVRSLAYDSTANIIYAGGDFTTVNGGTARNYLAAFNADTGLASSFDPSADSSVNALALSSNRAKLFTGGNFSSMGGAVVGSFAVFTDPTIVPTPGSGSNSGSSADGSLADTGQNVLLLSLVGGALIASGLLVARRAKQRI